LQQCIDKLYFLPFVTVSCYNIIFFLIFFIFYAVQHTLTHVHAQTSSCMISCMVVPSVFFLRFFQPLAINGASFVQDTATLRCQSSARKYWTM